MTYIVSGGALNSTHSLTPCLFMYSIAACVVRRWWSNAEQSFDGSEHRFKLCVRSQSVVFFVSVPHNLSQPQRPVHNLSQPQRPVRVFSIVIVVIVIIIIVVIIVVVIIIVIIMTMMMTTTMMTTTTSSSSSSLSSSPAIALAGDDGGQFSSVHLSILYGEDDNDNGK